MVLLRRFLPLLAFVAASSFATHASTITGTVKGPAGKAFSGAFVQAQNAKTKITVSVLSDTKGSYRIDDLPAGEYRLTIRAVGYHSDPRAGLKLSAANDVSFDFSLQSGTVHWNDISLSQAMRLFPAAHGKDLLFQLCSTCHGFQTRMASVTRDAEGWKDRVAYMTTAMRYGLLAHTTDQEAEDVSMYLTRLFGPETNLPKSPADMPGYKETVRSFGNDAFNIVYVEYEMPGPNRMPFSAAPDSNGNVWIPNYGVDARITRLNAKTGEMQDFSVGNTGTAGVHSAIPAPDGSVWLTEEGLNRLGRWDPKTQKITEFQDRYIPGKEGLGEGGSKHTVRIDATGTVWSTGTPLTKFDPETKKFTRFENVENAYGIEIDKIGNIWFTSPRASSIGKVDGKTMKVTKWDLPTKNSFPRRILIAPDGMIWIGEFDGGKLARFDPNAKTFKEYTLPGPDPSPYAMGFDAEGYLWYNSHKMDELGRFDTKTGKVTEYPFPQSELCMREFFRDSQGRMWFGTNPNNKVGYFYLAKKRDDIASKN